MLSQSLLTGQKYIDLDFLPEEPARLAGIKRRYPELPTTPTAMEKLGDQAETFFAKLAELPLDQMLEDLRKALQSLREVLSSPDLKGAIAGAHRAARSLEPTLADARAAIADARALIRELDGRVKGIGSDAEATLREMRETLDAGPADARVRRAHAVRSRRGARPRSRDARGAGARDEGDPQPGGLHPDPPRGDGAGQAPDQGEEVMRARAAFPVLAAALVLGAGCVSLKRTPEARFFVLRSVAEPARLRPAADARRGFVGVMPVRLPGHLDRPQLVTWTAPGELRIDEFLRWGEPLDPGFTRTLAENLGTLLPEHFVARSPWRASAVPRCRVVTELRVFGLQPNGEVRLDGRWALLPAHGEQPLARGSASLSRGPLTGGPAGADPGAEVDAMSELVGRAEPRDRGRRSRAARRAEGRAPPAGRQQD